MAARRERDTDGRNEEAGGGFGKFCKRPFRKSAATPYARPPPAALAAPSVGAWISKIVDPAQKLLTSGAQRFFASVFRKRLTNAPSQPVYAPTTEPVSNQGTQICNREGIVTSSVSRVLEPTSTKNLDNGIEKDSITDLWQTLQQQTFTRSEVERLTSLLQSKIVDEPSTEANPISITTHVTLPIERHDGVSESPVRDLSRENIPVLVSNASGVNGLPEHVASPTELAKAFMDGRSSYVSPSKINSSKPSLMKGQPNALASITHSPKSPSMQLIPSSTDQPGFQHNGFATPRSIGRSALYGMVRTPYSRSIWSTNSQGHRTPLSSLGGSSSSFQDSKNNSRSIVSRPESLKRRSSLMENDGDVSNIRRIRQKSNLLPSSGILSSRSSRLSVESSQPKSMKGKSVITSEVLAKNANDSSHASEFNIVPSKSSEMASKILKQLDSLVPSREKTPSKLSQSMLRGPALRSLESVEPPKFLLDDHRDDQASHHEESLPVNKSKLVDDDRERNADERTMMLLNKSVAKDDIPRGVKNEAPNGHSKTLTNPEAPSTSAKRRAFQMSAQEVYLEPDDDDYTNGSLEKVKQNDAVENNIADMSTSKKENIPIAGGSKISLLKSQEHVEKNNPAATFSATITPWDAAEKETPVVLDKLSQPNPISTILTSASFPETFAGTKPLSSMTPENTTTRTAFIPPIDSTNEPTPKILTNDSVQVDTSKASEVPSASTPFATSGIFSFGASSSNSSPSNGSFASSSIISSTSFTASTSVSPAPSPTASFFSFGSSVSQPSVSTEAKAASESTGIKINGFEFGGANLPSSAPVPKIGSVAMPSSFAPFGAVAPATFGDTSSAASSSGSVFGSSLSTSTPPSFTFGGSSTFSASGSLSNSSPSPSTSIFGSSAVVSASSSSPSTGLFGGAGGLSSSSSLTSTPIFGASSTAPSFSSASSSSIFGGPSAVTSTVGLSGTTSFPSFNAASAATTASSLFESSSAANPSSTNPIFNFNSGTTSSFNSFTSSTQSSSNTSTSPLFQFGSSISPTSFGSTPTPISTPVFNSSWQAPNSSSSPSAFVFGSSSASNTTPFSFGSSVPSQQLGNTEQNMVDSMAEDTVHAATTPPAFNPQPLSTGFAFGSSTTSANQFGSQSLFQFGSQANPSPFQATGGLDFQGSGSFSLGESGGEKATRRIVKVKKTMRKR